MQKKNEATTGVWAYFILTSIITLLTWGSMIALGIPGAAAGSAAGGVSPVGVLLLFLGGFAPSIAGIIMTTVAAGHTGLRNLWQRAARVRFAARWYLEILAIPFIALLIRLAVHVSGGGSLGRPTAFAGPVALFGFTLTILLGGALAEEFGWRGFALDRLISKYGLWSAMFMLGVLWVFWHLPLFFIKGTVQATRGNFGPEFVIFALWILALAVLFTWIYLGTGRSLFAVLLFHTAVDWFGTLAGNTIGGAAITDRLVNALVYAAFAVAVLVVWKLPARNMQASRGHHVDAVGS